MLATAGSQAVLRDYFSHTKRASHAHNQPLPFILPLQIEVFPPHDFWASLSSLRVLYLGGNVVSRREGLERLNGCPELHVLTLHETPLSLTKNYRHHVVNRSVDMLSSLPSSFPSPPFPHSLLLPFSSSPFSPFSPFLPPPSLLPPTLPQHPFPQSTRPSCHLG